MRANFVEVSEIGSYVILLVTIIIMSIVPILLVIMIINAYKSIWVQ
jgi:hypothetical protein